MAADKVRPARNFCLVLVEGREQAILGGLLYLPNSETSAEKLSQGTGSIVRLGSGEKIARLGIEVGDRVAYRGYLKYACPVQDEDQGREYSLIHVDDVIGVIAKEVSVGVFSSPVTHSRPAIKEKE